MYRSLRSVEYSTEFFSADWYLQVSSVRTGSNCFTPRLIGTNTKEW